MTYRAGNAVGGWLMSRIAWWGQALSGRWMPRTLEGRNIRYLTLDTAVQGIIGAGIGSFLAVFLVRMGASNTAVGLLTSAPALATIFLSVPGGAIAEGRPDQVRVTNLWRLPIRLSYLLVAAVPLVAGGETGAMLIVAIWTLTALPSAVVNPAWTNVVAETVPPDARPRVNGNRWALLSIVTALAGAAFGWLLDSIPFPLNYQLVFAISFLAGLVSIALFSRIRMPATSQAADAVRRVPRQGPLEVVADLAHSIREEGEFARYTLSTLVYRIGLNLAAALFPIFWVQDLQASDTTIGLRMMAGNATLVAAYFLWGRVAVRKGHRLVLILSSVGLSLYPILTALITTPDLLIPVAVVWGAFAAGIDIAFFEALLRTCPPDRRTSFVATNTAFANLAVFVAPLTGTLLADVLGIRAVLVLAGAISLAGAGLFYVMAVGRQPSLGAVADEGDPRARA